VGDRGEPAAAWCRVVPVPGHVRPPAGWLSGGGVAGGAGRWVAMGAVAAARRTQDSFAAYLSSTSPSDLTVLTGSYGPGPAAPQATIRPWSLRSPACLT
jgi:hypothetical protein